MNIQIVFEYSISNIEYRISIQLYGRISLPLAMANGSRDNEFSSAVPKNADLLAALIPSQFIERQITLQ